ncbi:hypothetical protein [Azospirillum lipoferum]|uniref:Uncharacterized protein n=1 Tax=Azospirillum lipoferum (strain 4B) TaxID=862719 RepID=G7Z5Y6_AZOL4|nr:hypothetical protein [Azospirillum lipoferum]CBS87833.1 protein of unknown function [Azospirillum lipoferum 4B]
MTSFKDHFSGHAGDCRAFRPTYPDGLAAVLAARFTTVHATDAGAEQIAPLPPASVSRSYIGSSSESQ